MNQYKTHGKKLFFVCVKYKTVDIGRLVPRNSINTNPEVVHFMSAYVVAETREVLENGLKAIVNNRLIYNGTYGRVTVEEMDLRSAFIVKNEPALVL